MAWNDPQWGNKKSGNNSGGNSGPPDLDELWKRFNQQLSGMFGGKGGGTPSGGSDMGGNVRGLAGMLIGLAVLVWVATGFYIVDAGEKGVVQRFGQYMESTGPGAHWRMPWPVESSRVVNVDGVRTIEVGYRGKSKNLQESLMLTDDENIVDLQFAVQYNLKSAEDFLFVNRYENLEDGEDVVRQAAETAMREVVGKNKMDFVLSSGRTEIAAQVKRLMQEILDRYKTGISISQINMQNVQAPEQVLAAFEDVQKAKQDQDRLKNEAQAYSNDVVPRARGEAARLLQEAEGYKQQVIANAQGDAARFSQLLVEYQKAPAVTRQRIYLDTMQQVMNNSTKVVVDQKGSGNLLYLPLDKLQQIASQPGSSVPETLRQPAPTAPASGPAPLSAGRESLGRDRGGRP
jgi:modulator of FtsH protease HflK